MKIWDAYLAAFARSMDELRAGAAPLRSDDAVRAERALVLIHGLTDSPYYMRAIAERFERAGWAVYLPLLDQHGSKEPGFMRGASAERWKDNVRYAVEAARARSASVSIGGLSTGGTLATQAVLSDEATIDGALLLFAGALGVHNRIGPFDLGPAIEFLLRTPLAVPVAAIDEFGSGLIGRNPYRYARVPFHGAVALAHLIGEVEALLAEPRNATINRTVFAAHSAIDTAASLEAVEQFLERVPPERRELFRFAPDERLRHAEIVLEQAVLGPDGEVLESANPRFAEMVDHAIALADRVR